MTKKLTLGLFMTGLLICVSGVYGQSQEKLPNIVFIMADDLGYGSLNAYGADKSLVRTPCLNRLSEEGMRFTNAHAPASICSPTRYSLLTGEYPWRSPLKFGVINSSDPLLLDPGSTTVADVLKEKSYQTAMIGKWHLGYGNKKPLDPTGKLTPGPLDLGFDYHFGIPNNHDDTWGVYIENDRVYGLNSTETHTYSRTFYGTRYIGIDAPQRVNKNVTAELAEKAVEWLRRIDKSSPFFLYFAPVAVHHPITPSDGMRGVSGCGPYGDFIQDLDQSISRVLEALAYLGLEENTLIIFTSDNGGEFVLSRKDSPEMIAREMGLKANGNWRGDKHTIWEGGTRVPFIVKWPGKVAPSAVSDQLISIVDVFATLHEIVEGEAPRRGTAPDSRSFLSILQGKSADPARHSLVTADARGIQALRMDGWKYIDDTPPEGLPQRLQKQLETFKPQLYHLSADPAEQNNLYGRRQDIVAKMKAELERIRAQPTVHE